MSAGGHGMRLSSALPGRERWEVAGLRGQARLGELMAAWLRARAGVVLVSVNALSGRLLLVFDETILPGSQRKLVEAALQSSVSGLAAYPAPAARPAGPARQPGPLRGNALYGLVTPIARDQAWTASAASALFSVSSVVTPIAPSLATTIAVTGGGLSAFGLASVSPAAQVALFGGLYLLNKAVETVLDYKSRIAWQRFASTVEHELRLKVFEHIELLDMASLESTSTSSLMKLVHDDAITIRRFLETVPHTGINKFNALALSALFLIWMSPAPFLLSMLPLPFIWYLFKRYHKKISDQYLNQGNQEGAIRKQLLNSFSGLGTIRGFGSEKTEREQLSTMSLALSESTYRAASFSLQYSEWIKFAVTTGLVLPMVYGGAMVLDGRLSPPLFLIQTFLLPKTIDTMIGFDLEYDLYQNAIAAAERMQNILAIRPQVTEGTVALPERQIGGELLFENLHFCYPSSRQIFRGFNLHVPACGTTAIVGSTGSGKSTLIKLLLRFYDPQQGRIELDGVDIRSLRFSSLRQAIGLVSQDVFLFHGTVYDNIAYGRPGASRAQVRAAAQIAQADDFIMSLPQGFETDIGEWGKNLSGGQRQRISIARVILKNPPILIFDEAMSSVDNETEAAIQRAIDCVSAGRTTIFIAHRLSTIRHVNQIHVMEDGRIVEQGTHDELMAKQRVYANLWHLQTAGHSAEP